MDDASWRGLEAALMAEGGTLPDGSVNDVGLSGWQALLDLISGRPWTCLFTLDGLARPVPASADDLFEPPALGLLAVWITPTIVINVFANSPESISFDFDTRAIVGGGLRAVGRFAADLGRATGKPVKLSHEGDESAVFLTFVPESDTFEASA